MNFSKKLADEEEKIQKNFNFINKKPDSWSGIFKTINKVKMGIIFNFSITILGDKKI